MQARAYHDSWLEGPALFAASPRPSARLWLTGWIRAALR
jgi:hypothetical protein